MWLFDKLIWTVLSYRVEIWNWQEKVERLEERYLKLILGVEMVTPGYSERGGTEG